MRHIYNDIYMKTRWGELSVTE